jgi:hypothetical protein
MNSRINQKINAKGNGCEKYLKLYKEEFNLPENKNHYSKKDYKKAERNYVKMRFCGQFIL